MAFPDDVWPAEDLCEVCGIRLGDEVVIQEFADGSLARLCPECAAGAALDNNPESASNDTVNEAPTSIWPEEPVEETSAVRSTESDPLEKTRELLMPVTDLITLQGEMQNALERLAGSLERFAAEVLTESQDKTAVESRLQMLERELEQTRARLEEAEFLLVGASGDTSAGENLGKTPGSVPAQPATDRRTDEPIRQDSMPTPGKATEEASAVIQSETSPELPTAFEPPTFEPLTFESPAFESPVAAPSPGAVPTSAEPVPDVSAGPIPVTLADLDAAAPAGKSTGFRIDEVQIAQRYYNESTFTNRVRDVRHSLGKPKANLTRIPSGEPRAVLTITWDIVWYQYVIDLRRDLPSGHERVLLHREGMDLDELPYYFKEPNALINDDGRLDASELEVRLLSDPSALITEMTPEEMKLLEDATEEIWDNRAAPEFKWDG